VAEGVIGVMKDAALAAALANQHALRAYRRNKFLKNETRMNTDEHGFLRHELYEFSRITGFIHTEKIRVNSCNSCLRGFYLVFICVHPWLEKCFTSRLRNELWKLFGKKRTYIGFTMFLLAQLIVTLVFRFSTRVEQFNATIGG